MKRFRRTSVKSERGYVLVLLALSLSVLFLLAGFAIDLGSWYLQASKLQRSSDAAALAGSAQLPDTNAATAAATAVFTRNGLVNGNNGIVISVQATSDTFAAVATNSQTPAYFTKAVKPNITLTRKASAKKGTSVPLLGSPFNVLGSGDLAISNIPKQNFWLAVNGVCSPKEDGDLFDALYDLNKGPFLATMDAQKNFRSAPGGKHTCPDVATKKNSDYDPRGYSYFVDIPKPPNTTGSVDLKIYSPSFDNNPGTNYPDQAIGLAADATYGILDTIYDVFDTNGTPENQADDIRLFDHPIAVDTEDVRTPPRAWWNLATIPYAKISNGGQFRIQVIPRASYIDNRIRGVNSFSIGAFASWKPAFAGCDSRKAADASCPRVYGRSAMSVFNNLNTSDSTVSFYFAEVGAAYTGSKLELMLWDPGEGVSKIEVLAPNGDPLKFDWSASGSGAGLSATNVDFIKTDVVESPARAGMSNPYKFNDRLVTIGLTLPADYPSKIAAASGDTFLRIRYTVNSAPNDRTTWGIKIAGGSQDAPRLVRPG